MSILAINDKSFESEVVNSELPVLIDFWAEWCGPCKEISPILDEINNEMHKKIKIVKVNIDDNPNIPNQYGVQCMSIGFLVDEETPMIWRGPMVTSAIKTFTQKVLWNDLDFIIIDMPPGTGDTQLTFAQEIKVDGVIIVSTPQEVALLDVKRGIRMFDKLKVPILGLVDNMSFFESDNGKNYNIFGEGGVEKVANNYKKDFLGKIPIDIDLRVAADTGKPLFEKNPDHKISKIFQDIAKKIKGSFL